MRVSVGIVLLLFGMTLIGIGLSGYPVRVMPWDEAAKNAGFSLAMIVVACIAGSFEGFFLIFFALLAGGVMGLLATVGAFTVGVGGVYPCGGIAILLGLLCLCTAGANAEERG